VPTSSATGTTSQAVGAYPASEQTVGTAGLAAGTYQLMLETNLLATGATPDIVEIRVYDRYTTAGTERIIGGPYSLIGAQSVAFVSFPHGSTGSLRFGLTQTQGTARAMSWRLTSF
jgi:hypothetical protein